MAYTINSCFEQFLRDSVNLDSDQTITARKSRDWLVSNIVNLANVGKIPSLHNETNHLFYGSFARNTKIRPLDDIDIMMVFHAQGSTCDDISKGIGKKYPIRVKDEANSLINYCDGNILNSRKLIEGIKKELANLPSYSKADIHRNQEAVTLKLSSYDWNFDIVPCFCTSTNFYVIPDGQGGWKGTDPRIDQRRTTNANQRFEGKLLSAIRLMKYWKNRYWGDCVSSYLFENFMIDWANSLIVFSQTYQQLVLNTLDFLAKKIMMDYNDPKGFQGNINSLDIVTRSELATKATNCCVMVRDAMQYERNQQNETAVNKWTEIFGNEFPKYGE